MFGPTSSVTCFSISTLANRHLTQCLGLLALLGTSSLQTAFAGELDIDLANIGQVNESREQISSINQFSDVYPTDWAYQALSNLIERYSCIAGYSNGTYRGNRAISRYEAAALLNACLDRVGEMTDELKRLMREFEEELAILRGRVDGLEARVGELGATQFSTTTTLNGLATFVVGANAFGGTDRQLRDASSRQFGATTFNYDLQLALETSFTGKDLLTTVLRAGNFNGENNSFGGAGPTTLSQLETAFQQDDNPDVLGIDKLFYSFPVGDSLTITVGPRVGQEDMLAVWPSSYPSDTILDVTTLFGTPGADDKNLGSGAGIMWAPSSNGLRFSANYVAANGSIGNPSEGGIGNENSGSTGTLQLGWDSENWQLAAVYTRMQNPQNLIAYATPHVLENLGENSITHAYGVAGSWQPIESGWIPSISLGWGINDHGTSRDRVSTSQSWNVGLNWSDVFLQGNSAGLAVGQPIFATASNSDETSADGNYVWEFWYAFQVSDNITVTPAAFYLSRPLGQNTPADRSFDQLGVLVKTSFTF